MLDRHLSCRRSLRRPQLRRPSHLRLRTPEVGCAGSSAGANVSPASGPDQRGDHTASCNQEQRRRFRRRRKVRGILIVDLVISPSATPSTVPVPWFSRSNPKKVLRTYRVDQNRNVIELRQRSVIHRDPECRENGFRKKPKSAADSRVEPDVSNSSRRGELLRSSVPVPTKPSVNAVSSERMYTATRRPEKRLPSPSRPRGNVTPVHASRIKATRNRKLIHRGFLLCARNALAPCCL